MDNTPPTLHGIDGDAFESDSMSFLDEPHTPHLVTGFFFIALVLTVAVFVAGTMDSQIRLGGVAIVSVVAALILFWLFVAQPTIEALAASRSQAQDDRVQFVLLEQDLQVAAATKERVTRKIGRLGGILAATQHELNREITMLGFAVDDLVDASEEGPVSKGLVEQLRVALSHVEEGQRNVAALSRLGTDDRVEKITAFRASDIVPLTTETTVVIERDDPIYGDADLWRLFVKNAVRNAETHGQAEQFALSTGDGRLVMSDDGNGCPTADLERSWRSGLRVNGTRSDGTQIMRRVAEAHDAYVTLQGNEGAGVRIVVDLRDLEIDLRERGVVSPSVGTPHKASGGRTRAPQT